MSKAKGKSEEKKIRLITVSYGKKGEKFLGKVLHIGYGCMVLDGKEAVDVTSQPIFEGMPICRVCLHFELGDYKNFPRVAIRPHILAELEKKFAAKEDAGDGEP